MLHPSNDTLILRKPNFRPEFVDIIKLSSRGKPWAPPNTGAGNPHRYKNEVGFSFKTFHIIEDSLNFLPLDFTYISGSLIM